MSAFLETFQRITAGDATFASITVDESEEWIALAVTELNATTWSALYVQGVAYLAAHKYAMGPGLSADSGSGGGAVAERRARNWAIRYQQTSGSSGGDGSLSETSYGREFLRMRALTRRPNLVFGTV